MPSSGPAFVLLPALKLLPLGEVDYRVLSQQARFVAWGGCPGTIWPQSGDSVELLMMGEKMKGSAWIGRRDRRTHSIRGRSHPYPGIAVQRRGERTPGLKITDSVFNCHPLSVNTHCIASTAPSNQYQQFAGRVIDVMIYGDTSST